MEIYHEFIKIKSFHVFSPDRYTKADICYSVVKNRSKYGIGTYNFLCFAGNRFVSAAYNNSPNSY